MTNMKTTLIAIQIVAAALLAPVAVSVASTTKAPVAKAFVAKASVAKPAAPPVQLQASAVPAPALKVETADTPASGCGAKVRVVYAGYSQPAPNRC